jgi:hypothetical protein
MNNACQVLIQKLRADPVMTDKRWIAYVLATVKHETNHTFEPIEERGSRKYFDKYETGTPIGKRLGNTQPGDGYRYRGRGYVQITGRGNYATMGRKLGLLLVDSPELACTYQTAYRIMIHGMYWGSFTGRNLDDYIKGDKCDFVNARRIINGTDKARLIAGYANDFMKIL